MQYGENDNYITKLECIPYSWHRGIISRLLVHAKYTRSVFWVKTRLDLRGITSVTWDSCYLVRIRTGKPL